MVNFQYSVMEKELITAQAWRALQDKKKMRNKMKNKLLSLIRHIILDRQDLWCNIIRID